MIRWVLQFILMTVFMWVIWRFLGGIIDGLGGGSRSRRGRRRGSSGQRGGGVSSVPLVRDPVCGTFVVRAKALTTGTGDQTQYFCSEKCRDEYRRVGG